MRLKQLLCAFGLLAGGPLLAHSAHGDDATVCAKAAEQAWFDDTWTCSQNGRGLAIAVEGEAAILAATLNEAAVQFETFFGAADGSKAGPDGSKAGKVAVIGSTNLTDTTLDFMAQHGFRTLPWINSASKGRLVRASVERQVMAQTQSLPEAQRQAILAQALAQLGDSGVSTSLKPSDTELGALAHEAGHLLFNQFYDGTAKSAGGEKRYGSSAPDWLDELAAVLLENETLTQGRYAAAQKRIAAGQSGPPLPLDAYLTMEHPSLAAAQALRERAGGGEGAMAIALTGEEARKFLEESRGDPAQFYVQSRLLADFLIDQSGERTIIAEIASAIRSGGTFESWLGARYGVHGFAPDMAGFTAQWERWIEARLAKAD